MECGKKVYLLHRFLLFSMSSFLPKTHYILSPMKSHDVLQCVLKYEDPIAIDTFWSKPTSHVVRNKSPWYSSRWGKFHL